MTLYRVTVDVDVEVDDLEAVRAQAHDFMLRSVEAAGGIVPNEFADTSQQGVDFMAHLDGPVLTAVVVEAVQRGSDSWRGARYVSARTYPPVQDPPEHTDLT